MRYRACVLLLAACACASLSANPPAPATPATPRPADPAGAAATPAAPAGSATAAPAAAPGAALQRVLDCMHANIPDTLRVQELEITARDRAGSTRMLRGRLYGMRDEGKMRAMLRIEAPPDLAGASYLVRETDKADDMYVFLPALNKVRRVMGGSKDSSLFGTDLSYNDIKQLQNVFGGADLRLEAPATVGGRQAHVLAVKPDAAEQSPYSQIRIWVDQKSCVTVKAEFMEGSTVRKVLEVDPAKLAQSGTHWYASEAQVRDVKMGTSTTLKVLGVKTDERLSGTYFNPKSFYIGG